jgi:hypothetical protein
MRRLWAILLVGLFSFSLITPILLAEDATSALPACCRRDGHHRCAASSQQNNGSGSSWRTARCAIFPATNTFLPGTGAGLSLAPSSVIFAEFAGHPVVHAQLEAFFRISHDRASQKRGPPSLS